LDAGADPEYSRQKFGEIVILINDNLLKKPCFRNYSENWTEDFKSNAIYKIFKYLNNFDPEKVSKVTGKKISSFAYLTQITYMAFVEVINKRKKDNTDLMDNMIPLQDLKPEHFSYGKFLRESTFNPDELKVLEGMSYIVLLEEDLIKESLFELMQALREKHDKVHVTYPLNYKISIEEYNNITGLNFTTLNLIKEVLDEEVLSCDESEEGIFEFADEEFEDFGEWLISDESVDE
jgi:hypothetical protein